jgi:sulfotransferase family protein
MLPNTLIIGAAKCGTSALHYYLGQHPQTSMSRPKELLYWHRPDWLERREWYEQQFEDAPVRCEATPAYTWYPHRQGTPERIHSVIPDVRLIYVVRDPIERLVSAWIQHYANGRRTPLSEWLSDFERPEHILVSPSRYATQMEQYLEFFPASQMMVIDQHELMTERRETLREVFSFLEIAPDFYAPELDQSRNKRSEKYALTRVGLPLWNQVLGPAVRRLPDFAETPVRRWTIRALSRKIRTSPTIEPGLRARLEEHFRPEVDRLRELTGKQFASWSV